MILLRNAMLRAGLRDRPEALGLMQALLAATADAPVAPPSLPDLQLPAVPYRAEARVAEGAATRWSPGTVTFEAFSAWIGLLMAGIGGLFVFLRRRTRAIEDAPLSAAEQRRAETLLNQQEEPKS
mgnify:CR=1 FL=1